MRVEVCVDGSAAKGPYGAESHTPTQSAALRGTEAELNRK